MPGSTIAASIGQREQGAKARHGDVWTGDMGQRSFDARNENLRRRSLCHAIVTPLEQRHSHRGLNPAKRLCYRRLSEIYRLGCGIHRPQIGDFRHGAQVAQVEIPNFHSVFLSEI